MRLGTSTFHCWKRGGHGTVDLRAAIIQSCDIFFYETAKRVGVDRIAAMGRRLGLGTPPGLDFPAERGGVLPTRDWKLATTGIPWQKGETLVAGIGQGYVLTTPLQLAVMTARIANGGLEVIPRLVSERNESDGTIVRAPVIVRGLGLNPAHLRAVQEGMVGVVNHARGTARQSAITEPGMQMAGKTGTAQVRRITKSERESGVIKNEDLPWERRDHALFIGYAPVDAPRYAVAVVVEHGGSGSQAAAPLACDILLAAQRSGGVPIAQARRQDRRIDRS
jgi:penicillin-binding protein 2